MVAIVAVAHERSSSSANPHRHPGAQRTRSVDRPAAIASSRVPRIRPCGFPGVSKLHPAGANTSCCGLPGRLLGVFSTRSFASPVRSGSGRLIAAATASTAAIEPRCPPAPLPAGVPRPSIEPRRPPSPLASRVPWSPIAYPRRPSAPLASRAPPGRRSTRVALRLRCRPGLPGRRLIHPRRPSAPLPARVPRPAIDQPASPFGSACRMATETRSRR
jgi:hypothetical protein